MSVARLSKCLDRAGKAFSQAEGDLLQRVAAEHQGDGLNGIEAAKRAVADVLEIHRENVTAASAFDILGTPPVNFDQELFAKGSRLMALYAKSGVPEFKNLSEMALNRIGEQARPYLLAWYEGLRSTPGVDEGKLDSPAEAQRRFAALGGDDGTRSAASDAGTDGGGRRQRSPVPRVVRQELIPPARDFVGTDSYAGRAGFKLDADQVVGVNGILSHFERNPNGGAFLLGDGTGFGKSAQIIGVIDQYRKAHPGARVLYVTQNKQMLAGSWKRDSERMGVDLNGVDTTTYTSLDKHPTRDYDLIAFDEAHSLKNGEAKKSMAAARLRGRHTIYSTATPMDRPTGAAYFLAQITGEDENTVATKLGYEYAEREDPYTKELYNYPVLLKGNTWATVWQHIQEYRDAAVAAGAMLRREYPFYGKVAEEVVGWDGLGGNVAEEIEAHFDALIEEARSPNYRRNLAGQKTLTSRRWAEINKVRQTFALAQAHLESGGSVVIMAETDKEQSFPVQIPGGMMGRNDKGNTVWRVPGALARLDRMFAEQGIEVAHVHDTRNNVVADEVEKFQSGQVRVVLATPKSGGAGINLDDTVGDKPRLLISMSPELAGDVFDQVLGRVSRKTTQSEATVKLLHNPQAFADERSKDIRDTKIRTLRAIQGGADLDRAGFEAPPLGTPAAPKEAGQGDLFAGGETGGDTTFNLSGENAKDFTGVVDKQAESADAKKKQAKEQGDLFGTPGDSGVDDSVASSIQFEDAPAEYASRPDIQDRIRSFVGPDERGTTLKVPRLASDKAGAARTIAALERAFGKRILFVQKDGLSFGAASHPDYPNTVIVNAAADAPFVQLVGHELTHNLAKQDKALYGRLRRAVEKLAPMPAEFAALKREQNYTDEQIPAEWVGDVVGERMGDPVFWRGVIRETNEGRGGNRGAELRDLAREILGWMRRLVDRLKRTLFGTSEFVKEADRLHRIIDRVMTEAAGRSPYAEVRGAGDAELSTSAQVNPDTTMSRPGSAATSEVDETAPAAQRWVPVADESADPAILDRVRAIEAALNRERRAAGEQPVRLNIAHPAAPAAGSTGGDAFDRGIHGLSQAFGKRIIFVTPSEDIGMAAVTSPETANTILVSTDAVQPLHVLVGHELTHNLRTHRPELYERLRDTIRTMVERNPVYFGKWKRAQGYKTDEAIEAEWIGDVVGERLDEPEFWSEFARVSGQTGGKAQQVGFMRQLALYMQEWMGRMTGRVRNLLSNTHEYTKQLSNLQTAVAEIMAEYAGKAGDYADLKGGKEVSDAELSHPRNDGPLGTPSLTPGERDDMERDMASDPGAAPQSSGSQQSGPNSAEDAAIEALLKKVEAGDIPSGNPLESMIAHLQSLVPDLEGPRGKKLAEEAARKYSTQAMLARPELARHLPVDLAVAYVDLTIAGQESKGETEANSRFDVLGFKILEDKTRRYSYKGEDVTARMDHAQGLSYPGFFYIKRRNGDPMFSGVRVPLDQVRTEEVKFPAWFAVIKGNGIIAADHLKDNGFDRAFAGSPNQVFVREATDAEVKQFLVERSPNQSRGGDAAQSDVLGTPAVKGDAEQEAVIDKVTGSLEDKRTLFQKFRDYYYDLDDWLRFEFQQKLLDSFTAIKRLEKHVLGTTKADASVSAYKWSRLTKNLPDVMEYLFKHGTMAYDKGSMAPVEGSKGLAQILKPVADAGKLRLWEAYVAAKRAAGLLAEGKEKNFGKYLDAATGKWEHDPALAKKEIDALLRLGEEHPELETARKEYVEWQNAILDLAEKAGLIDPDKRKLWQRSDYVPFYRIVEALDGEGKHVKGPRKRRGFSSQSANIRKLKGGRQQVAILENIFRNAEQLVDASFKNIAMQRITDLADQDEHGDLMVNIPYRAVPFRASYEETVKALEQAGVDTESLTEQEINEMVTFWRMRAPKGDDIVSVMHEGRASYYRVKDKPLLRSILTLGPARHSFLMRALMMPKRGLTHMVTLDPAFMAANSIRDTLSAWTIADSPIKPGWDSFRGYVAALRNDPLKLAVMANGGGSGHYNRITAGEVRKAFAKMTADQRHGFESSIIDTPAKLWRLYKDMGRATENANRLAIAESVRKGGGSPAEAAFQALDLMDFGLRGDSAALGFFLDTVPFMNARMQGLYKLGRAMKENPRRVATHGALIVGASLALLGANWDDDRYWDLPEWDRDLYYHLWIGGRHLRIPKPFEVGQIFSTLPERFTQFMAKDGDSKVLARRLLAMMSETFAFNLTPQALKPALDVARNTNPLTGHRIISQGDEYKAPEEQFNAFTSATAREMANAAPDLGRYNEWMRSPKTLEHLIRGYFGSLGMYALDAADAVVRSAANYPELPASKAGDYWLMRRFAPESDLRDNKYISEFYELNENITAIANRMRTLAEQGDYDKAQELATDKADLLAYGQRTRSVEKAMNVFRRQERDIHENPRGRSPEQRRQELAGIKARKNELAKQTVQSAPRRPQPVFNPWGSR